MRLQETLSAVVMGVGFVGIGIVLRRFRRKRRGKKIKMPKKKNIGKSSLSDLVSSVGGSSKHAIRFEDLVKLGKLDRRSEVVTVPRSLSLYSISHHPDCIIRVNLLPFLRFLDLAATCDNPQLRKYALELCVYKVTQPSSSSSTNPPSCPLETIFKFCRRLVVDVEDENGVKALAVLVSFQGFFVMERVSCVCGEPTLIHPFTLPTRCCLKRKPLTKTAGVRYEHCAVD